MTHTPGPWSIGEYRTGISDSWREGESLYERAIYSADQTKLAVCEQWIGDKESAEAEANAALIAAAPQLLAALEATIKPLVRLGDFIGNEDNGGASGLGHFDRCAIILQARAAIAQAKGGG